MAFIYVKSFSSVKQNKMKVEIVRGLRHAKLKILGGLGDKNIYESTIDDLRKSCFSTRRDLA